MVVLRVERGAQACQTMTGLGVKSEGKIGIKIRVKILMYKVSTHIVHCSAQFSGESGVPEHRLDLTRKLVPALCTRWWLCGE